MKILNNMQNNMMNNIQAQNINNMNGFRNIMNM